MSMSRERVSLGEVGENLACEELRRRGYAILARRYRRRGGEVDIIARDPDGCTTVFIEVKTRNRPTFGTGADAVTWLKRRRLIATATDYLARHCLVDRPCRFDVVAIGLESGSPVVEVFPNAFDAGV
jgi:putative endonuclease